jgi:stage III sporulation protein AE
MTDNIIERLDLTGIQGVLDDTVHNTVVNFPELIRSAVFGELDLSMTGLMDITSRLVFGQLTANASLMRNLVVIGLLAAVLRLLTEHFKTKEVGELGFYLCYAVSLSILLTSFRLGADIVVNMVSVLSRLMYAAAPIMIGLMVLTGRVSSALFNPLLIFMIMFMSYAVSAVFLPATMVTASIGMVSNITKKDMLSRLTEFCTLVIRWSSRGLMGLFIAVFALQKISLPIADNLALGTTRAAVKAIPGVGGIMESAVTTVINFSTAAKSGFLVALLIAIVVICGGELLKLLAFVLMYKFIAALLQPVCDPRFVKCVDAAAEFSAIILELGVIVVVLFMFAAIMLLAF